MSVYLQTWCPGDPCDPCGCHWDINREPGTTTFHHNEDGTIDQGASFCGVPFWGLGAKAVTPGGRGDIVDGYVDISLSGDYAELGPYTNHFSGTIPEFPPEVKVQFGGVDIFTFDPSLGTIINAGGLNAHSYVTTGALPVCSGVYQATARFLVHNCIMLGDPPDVLQFNGELKNFDCVLPYPGSIPDPISTLDITLTTTSVGPTLFTAFIVYGSLADLGADIPLALSLTQSASFEPMYPAINPIYCRIK